MAAPSKAWYLIVDDLKEAIKHKVPNALKDYDATSLVVKAVKKIDDYKPEDLPALKSQAKKLSGITCFNS